MTTTRSATAASRSSPRWTSRPTTRTTGAKGNNDDHPIAWCSDFDGGHVWYTGLGHTAESFGTGAGNIRSHILGGLETVTGAEPSDCGEPRQASPQPSDFEQVTIDDDTESPMELAVANDGRVFYVERITGEVNVYNPANGQVTTAIQLPVSSVQENGAMGIALDPNFDVNHYVYITYTPLPNTNNVSRISRFTVGANNTISRGVRAVHLPVDRAAHGVLPLRRLARLRAERRPLPVDRRQHQPVRVRRLRADRRAARP